MPAVEPAGQPLPSVDAFSPLEFARGPAMCNRLALAPLTNSQSGEDGRLSEAELNWLVLRARGGFGLTMTCAAHVQEHGRGFPGQLGIFSDGQLEGLTRLAAAIRAQRNVAIVQLYHGGMRAPAALTGVQPVCPSDDAETGARAMRLQEIEQLATDFVAAALRAEAAGFDGVELHGAHGYLLSEFLSPELNRREDRYGGSLENRSRLLFWIVEEIRSRCRPDFLLGVRLSPERFGQRLAEAREVAARLLAEARIDFLDLSLWDVFKQPVEAEFQGRSLLSYFTELERGRVRLGAAGRLTNGNDLRRCLDAGVDFAIVGRAAILHADFPQRLRADPAFAQMPLPVTPDYLAAQGLSPAFVQYLRAFKGFVAA